MSAYRKGEYMRLADSIRESRRARIWRCLRGKELTDIESGKETGCMGRADLSLPEQRSRREIVVEITLPPQPGGNIAVTVRVAGAETEIYSGADAQTVELVLRVLQSC